MKGEGGGEEDEKSVIGYRQKLRKERLTHGVGTGLVSRLLVGVDELRTSHVTSAVSGENHSRSDGFLTV